MSTWTFKGPLAALGLGFLSGCGDGGLPFGAAPDQATGVALSRGAVMLAAPPGYCVDERALRRAPRGDFALLARCDNLGFRGFFSSREPALITVTTAPRDADTPAPDLAELERSVAPATVMEARLVDGLPLVRVETPGEDPVAGIAPQHWRGAFALNGQLVALALYAPGTGDDDPKAGAELLADLARRTAQASAPTPPDNTRPDPVARAPQPIPDTAPSPPADHPGDSRPRGIFSPRQVFGLIGGLFD